MSYPLRSLAVAVGAMAVFFSAPTKSHAFLFNLFGCNSCCSGTTAYRPLFPMWSGYRCNPCGTTACYSPNSCYRPVVYYRPVSCYYPSSCYSSCYSPSCCSSGCGSCGSCSSCGYGSCSTCGYGCGPARPAATDAVPAALARPVEAARAVARARLAREAHARPTMRPRPVPTAAPRRPAAVR